MFSVGNNERRSELSTKNDAILSKKKEKYYHLIFLLNLYNSSFKFA